MRAIPSQSVQFKFNQKRNAIHLRMHHLPIWLSAIPNKLCLQIFADSSNPMSFHEFFSIDKNMLKCHWIYFTVFFWMNLPAGWNSKYILWTTISGLFIKFGKSAMPKTQEFETKVPEWEYKNFHWQFHTFYHCILFPSSQKANLYFAKLDNAKYNMWPIEMVQSHFLLTPCCWMMKYRSRKGAMWFGKQFWIFASSLIPIFFA